MSAPGDQALHGAVHVQFTVQDWDDAPEQAVPPHPGDGELHVRVCVPLVPQAVAEQALQADQPPSTGSLPVQAREKVPAQGRPPHDGDGLMHPRV